MNKSAIRTSEFSIEGFRLRDFYLPPPTVYRLKPDSNFQKVVDISCKKKKKEGSEDKEEGRRKKNRRRGKGRKRIEEERK